MSSSDSPCAACKVRRQKCTQECVFAPYFPPDQLEKFIKVHRVFGASNVAKLLRELSTNLREDAVNSLAYEAESRLRDPIYGCVGLISILQQQLKHVQSDLYNAKKELATYIGPQAMMSMLQAQAYMPQQYMGNPSASSTVTQYGMLPMMDIPTLSPYGGQLMIPDPLHHQQQELVRFNSGFDASGGTITPTGFNQMSGAAMSPSLALGSFNNSYQIQAQQQLEHHHHHLAHSIQEHLLLQSQQRQMLTQQHQPPKTQQKQKCTSEEAYNRTYEEETDFTNDDEIPSQHRRRGTN